MEYEKIGFNGTERGMVGTRKSTSILCKNGPMNLNYRLLRFLISCLVCCVVTIVGGIPSGWADEGGRDFELYSLDGTLFNLKRLRSAETTKVVVVDFFEVSCIPCRKALPKWSDLYKELKAKGMRMVVVALPGPEDRATAESKLQLYFKKNPVPFPVVFDKYKKVAQLYGVEKDGSARLPQAFLINPDGNEIIHGKGPEDLETRLRKEIVNKNASSH